MANTRLRLRTSDQLVALLADPATSAADARYARAILAERQVSYSLNARR